MGGAVTSEHFTQAKGRFDAFVFVVVRRGPSGVVKVNNYLIS